MTNYQIFFYEGKTHPMKAQFIPSTKSRIMRVDAWPHLFPPEILRRDLAVWGQPKSAEVAKAQRNPIASGPYTCL